MPLFNLTCSLLVAIDVVTLNMDENAMTSRHRPILYEKYPRKFSLFKTLSELTSNAFRRRHTSGTLASPEGSINVQPISYLPTLSFGSRTSSLFGSLFGRLSIDWAAKDTESSQSKNKDRRGAQAEMSTPSSRKNPQLTCDSASSFFGNNTSGALYPEEFLEKPDSATWEKETATTSLRQGDNAQPYQLTQRSLRWHESQSSLSGNLGPSGTEASKVTSGPSTALKRHKENAERVPSTVRVFREIPTRLANKRFIKRRSDRHGVESVPPVAPSKSTASPSSTRIKECRLMAPISPPLPRTSLASSFDTPPSKTNHQSSLHESNFIHPTSTSTARTTQISRSNKPPPPPLILTGGDKTRNMTGFSAARAHAVAKREGEKKELELEEQKSNETSTIGTRTAANQKGGLQPAVHGTNDVMGTSNPKQYPRGQAHATGAQGK